MPRISVIIPNYNGEKYIKACLNGVFSQTYPDFEAIVVDNGSMDHSIDIIMEEFPKVKLILLQDNLGIAGGVNSGIKSAEGEFVAILHNDAIPSPNWLESMVAIIEMDDNIFSVSPLVMMQDKPEIIDNAGDAYTIFGAAYHICQGKRVNKVKLKNKRIFSSSGCGGLYRKSMLIIVGGFDQDFFAYLEDMDIGWRAMLFGYKNVFCADSIVAHHGNGTMGSKYNDFKARLSARNNSYLIYKNMPWWQLAMCKPFMLMSGMLKKQVYGKRELKKFYQFGLSEAKQNKKNVHKVRYTKKRWKRQLFIGLLLIKYSVLYPFIRQDKR